MDSTPSPRALPIPVLFLDFEASSLADTSWPIEIGFAWLDEGWTVQSESHLIRPHDGWSMEAWSLMSESIHRIPHGALLREGKDAATVWHAALARMARRATVSDNPGFEAFWMRRLGEAATGAIWAPPIGDMEALFAQTLQAAGMDAACEYLAKHPTPHRAGQDAARLASAWRKGLLVDAGVVPLRP